MKTLASFIILMWASTAGIAIAERSSVVVELFTSQGCSSCPPADRLLHELAARDDVIALALHVDYWDYIGWKDQFAVPLNADRQKAYAATAGRRMIFTPEMIINGLDSVVGTRAMQVVDEIYNHANRPRIIELNAEREGDLLSIDAVIKRAPEKNIVVQLVRYTSARDIFIERGENAGLQMTYANVISSWKTIGQWDGKKNFSLNFPVKGEEPVVVLMQYEGHGEILNAIKLD
ncbi:MAG: DUF1223 domain-containing protein [Aestuariivita sp.]|nr:DUF1223 domain-containing protein [Aestuariivita sp.]